jgi:hypothetical protein
MTNFFFIKNTKFLNFLFFWFSLLISPINFMVSIVSKYGLQNSQSTNVTEVTLKNRTNASIGKILLAVGIFLVVAFFFGFFGGGSGPGDGGNGGDMGHGPINLEDHAPIAPVAATPAVAPVTTIPAVLANPLAPAPIGPIVAPVTPVTATPVVAPVIATVAGMTAEAYQEACEFATLQVIDYISRHAYVTRVGTDFMAIREINNLLGLDIYHDATQKIIGENIANFLFENGITAGVNEASYYGHLYRNCCTVWAEMVDNNRLASLPAEYIQPQVESIARARAGMTVTPGVVSVGLSVLCFLGVVGYHMITM